LKKIIANLSETSASLEFIGPITSAELHRVADTLEQMAVALEKLTGNKADVPVEAKNSPGELVNNDMNPAVLEVNIPITDVLEDYLEQKGIKIKPPGEKLTPQEQSRRDKLNLLALFLGNNLNDCMALYQWLKGNLSSKNTNLSYPLKDANSGNKEKITNFCNQLKKAGLLKSFSFQALPENRVQLEFTGTDTGFLKGIWLERFIEQKMRRFLKESRAKGSIQEYKIRANPKIIFKDNTEGEIDLFFAVGEKIFCLEVKTFPSAKDLKDVINKLKPLELKDQNILIVTAEKSSEQCDRLTQALGGIKVVGLGNLEEAVNSMINAA
jgi:hypothetical protein